MNEQFYDGMLNIKTGGIQKGFHTSVHYHRYEPTPYSALEKLFRHYELTESDRVVDFGCGKGRLIFYTHYLFRNTVVGIEMDEKLFHDAVENRTRYTKKNKNSYAQIHLHCCLAEDYPIHPLDNRFYFFNPFTIQIFRKIINNILRSIEISKRRIELVLYYPSEEYIDFLGNSTSFILKEELIDRPNSNERFLIYELLL
jgi:SAM-dependent methyltransferase